MCPRVGSVLRGRETAGNRHLRARNRRRKPSPGLNRRSTRISCWPPTRCVVMTLKLGFHRAQLVVGGDAPGPDLPVAASRASSAGAPSSKVRPRRMMAMRGHSSRTSSTMCVERMTVTSAPMDAEQVEEAIALGGVEARGRLVDDDEARIGRAAPGRCRSAASCRRSKCSRRLLAHVPEIGLVGGSPRRSRCARVPSADALQHGKWCSMSRADSFGYTPNSCGR